MQNAISTTLSRSKVFCHISETFCQIAKNFRNQKFLEEKRSSWKCYCGRLNFWLKISVGNFPFDLWMFLASTIELKISFLFSRKQILLKMFLRTRRMQLWQLCPKFSDFVNLKVLVSKKWSQKFKKISFEKRLSPQKFLWTVRVKFLIFCFFSKQILQKDPKDMLIAVLTNLSMSKVFCRISETLLSNLEKLSKSKIFGRETFFLKMLLWTSKLLVEDLCRKFSVRTLDVFSLNNRTQQ